jgi:secernin
MCDTMVATPRSSADGSLLFGKNSDRQRNEAQTIEILPSADQAERAQLDCTHIRIPQVRHTYSVLLCRPFWMWGAEMGANEHGVVIGNEGLHARSPSPQTKALIGMDLLRLALERAATAAEAVEVITALLERFGQGGNCGHLAPSYYNNGFIIADPAEAFVLETVGSEWLVERVGNVRAISNEYSIVREAQRTSVGLYALLQDFGWNGESVPNYADLITDPQTAHVGSARARSTRANSLLNSGKGNLRIETLMNILRDHDPTGQETPEWHPTHKALTFSLCIHAGVDHRSSQTTGTLASEIRLHDSVHWVTGTAAPCLSIFKPALLGTPLPDRGPTPTDRFNAKSLWWRHELLHRAALMGDFATFLQSIRHERDSIEADFRGRIASVLKGGNDEDRRQVVAACWKEALEAEDRWAHRLSTAAFSVDETPHRAMWQEMNRIAGLHVPPGYAESAGKSREDGEP